MAQFLSTKGSFRQQKRTWGTCIDVYRSEVDPLDVEIAVEVFPCMIMQTNRRSLWWSKPQAQVRRQAWKSPPKLMRCCAAPACCFVMVIQTAAACNSPFSPLFALQATPMQTHVSWSSRKVCMCG